MLQRLLRPSYFLMWLLLFSKDYNSQHFKKLPSPCLWAGGACRLIFGSYDISLPNQLTSLSIANSCVNYCIRVASGLPPSLVRPGKSHSFGSTWHWAVAEKQKLHAREIASGSFLPHPCLWQCLFHRALRLGRQRNWVCLVGSVLQGGRRCF